MKTVCICSESVHYEYKHSAHFQIALPQICKYTYAHIYCYVHYACTAYVSKYLYTLKMFIEHIQLYKCKTNKHTFPVHINIHTAYASTTNMQIYKVNFKCIAKRLYPAYCTLYLTSTLYLNIK